MALIFFSDKYEEMYNCSFYNYEDKIFEDRSNLFFGWLYLFTTIVIWIIYIPCIIVMSKKCLIKHSCYKLMICHAIFDLNFSLYAGLWSGILNVTGNVYCHWPRTAFVIGFLYSGAWKAQSSATVLLALNRCLEAYSKCLTDKLFSGKRIYFWAMIPVFAEFRDIIWGPVVFFSPVHSVLTYNPHEGYFPNEDLKYSDYFIFYYNLYIGISIVSIYGIFAIYIIANSKCPKTTSRNAKVFGQIWLISLCFVVAMALFVITQFYQLPPFINPWITYSYLLLCGLPPVIYLTFNKTLRNNFLKMFRSKPKVTVVLFTIRNKDNYT